MAPHEGYRPDIDGLRAVAVLPVVLYHAGMPWVSGGFVGVDVFFVISGFLITGIVRREIEAGRFSLLHFYDRRIRRILPALFAVLTASFVTALILLDPIDLKTFGRSVVAAGLFASNVFFQRDDGYFAADAAEKPLLHTWSLSVEEQFYIVWPLILLLVLTRIPRRIGLVLTGVFVFSLGATQIYLVFDPDAAFYLAPLRAWELIVGAFLAFPLLPACRSEGLRNALGAIGLGFIAWSVVTYDHGTQFPGVAALVPCLGAALVIYSGAAGPSMTARLLGWRPVTFVGLISYSLYLWHWPVLVFVRYHLGRDPTLAEAFSAIALAVVLAILSWWLIERPFRARVPVSNGLPSSVRVATAGVLCVVASGGVLVSGDGLRGRFAPDVLEALEIRHDRGRPGRRCRAEEGQGLPQHSDCFAGAGSSMASYDTVLWGDSHAQHYFPALIRLAANHGVRVRLVSKGGCPPLPGTDLIDEDGGDRRHCRAFHEAAFAEILGRRETRLVVLAARWARYSEATEHGPTRKPASFLVTASERSLTRDSARHVLAGTLERTVARLRDAGKTVLILGQVPEFGFGPPACVAQRRMGRERDCTTAMAGVAARQTFANRMFENFGRQSGVFVFRPTDHLCTAQRCDAELDGRIVYRDRSHLTRDGALYLANFMTLPPFEPTPKDPVVADGP